MGWNGTDPEARPAVKDHPHLTALRVILALPEDATLDDAREAAMRGITEGWDHDEP